jgi:CHASE2 domain-containing sensor protein
VVGGGARAWPLITWFQYGIWSAFAMFSAWCFHNKLSRPLGIGMLIQFFVFGCLCRLLEPKSACRPCAGWR